jgi:SNF2 family DNA or RNA helicase
VFPWSSDSFTKRFTRERVVDMDYATGETGVEAKKRAAPGINPDQIPEFRRATVHLMHRLIIRDPEVTGVKFPPVNYHLVNCDMEPDHSELYYRIQTNALEDIKSNLNQMANNRNSFRLRQNVLGNIQTLRRAASCPWSIEGLAYSGKETSKTLMTVDLCKQLVAEGRKVIIFTNFVSTGKPLVDALRVAGLEVTRIYAEDKAERPALLSQEAREERIEEFLENPKVNVLVGNLTLLSTGLTMVQASAIINHDHDWRANTYRQGISRVVRPGQVHSHVDVYDLVTSRSVDVYIYTALMRKLEATAQVVDGQFVLADDPDKLDVDPLSVAKALISGDFAIGTR